jgi:hypothetical protein
MAYYRFIALANQTISPDLACAKFEIWTIATTHSDWFTDFTD